MPATPDTPRVAPSGGHPVPRPGASSYGPTGQTLDPSTYVRGQSGLPWPWPAQPVGLGDHATGSRPRRAGARHRRQPGTPRCRSAPGMCRWLAPHGVALVEAGESGPHRAGEPGAPGATRGVGQHRHMRASDTPVSAVPTMAGTRARGRLPLHGSSLRLAGPTATAGQTCPSRRCLGRVSVCQDRTTMRPALDRVAPEGATECVRLWLASSRWPHLIRTVSRVDPVAVSDSQRLGFLQEATGAEELAQRGEMVRTRQPRLAPAPAYGSSGFPPAGPRSPGCDIPCRNRRVARRVTMDSVPDRTRPEGGVVRRAPRGKPTRRRANVNTTFSSRASPTRG